MSIDFDGSAYALRWRSRIAGVSGNDHERILWAQPPFGKPQQHLLRLGAGAQCGGQPGDGAVVGHVSV